MGGKGSVFSVPRLADEDRTTSSPGTLTAPGGALSQREGRREAIPLFPFFPVRVMICSLE